MQAPLTHTLPLVIQPHPFRQARIDAATASETTPLSAGLPSANSGGSAVSGASGAMLVWRRVKGGPGSTTTVMTEIDDGTSSARIDAASRPSIPIRITTE